jgi:hypothetical protein
MDKKVEYSLMQWTPHLIKETLVTTENQASSKLGKMLI